MTEPRSTKSKCEVTTDIVTSVCARLRMQPHNMCARRHPFCKRREYATPPTYTIEPSARGHTPPPRQRLTSPRPRRLSAYSCQSHGASWRTRWVKLTPCASWISGSVIGGAGGPP